MNITVMNQPPLRIIESHTEGEPTRVVISGGPDLGEGGANGKGRVAARAV
jgi:4-hydroxyproline epimerase